MDRLALLLEVDVRPTTPAGVLVATCAALGSPVSELSKVSAEETSTLRSAVVDGRPLPLSTSLALSTWLPCLWWRTLYREGLEVAVEERELYAVAMLSNALPYVPSDWSLDFARAFVLDERREPLPWPIGKRGENNGRAKLTREKVEEIRGRFSRGRSSLRKLAKIYGVSPSLIHRIVRGNAW